MAQASSHSFPFSLSGLTSKLRTADDLIIDLTPRGFFPHLFSFFPPLLSFFVEEEGKRIELPADLLSFPSSPPFFPLPLFSSGRYCVNAARAASS